MELKWKYGTCMACGLVGVVYDDTLSPTPEPGTDGHECCEKCANELWDSMSYDYEPKVYEEYTGLGTV